MAVDISLNSGGGGGGGRVFLIQALDLRKKKAYKERLSKTAVHRPFYILLNETNAQTTLYSAKLMYSYSLQL